MLTQNFHQTAKIASLTVQAQAKLNLHLAVKNRREDGFHNIESIFLALDFGDTLYFQPIAAPNHLEICMEWENYGDFSVLPVELPMEKNIIFKAVSSFREKTGFNQGLRIRVKKRIPAGGGLGGGSSNAASTLLALNKLAREPLPPNALAQMAASLGSDVPFFLHETPAAWVSGRGEFIKPITAPNGLFFVLVNPGFSSETAAAFRLLSEFRAATMEKCISTNESEEQLMLNALQGAPKNWPFRNDFLPAFLHRANVSDVCNAYENCGAQTAEKAYADILGRLKKSGAEFAGLSGAGSTCFGVFTNRAKAVQACEAFSKIPSFAKLTFFCCAKSKTSITMNYE